MIATSDSVCVKHWAVRIEDFGRIKWSPWFSARQQCIEWLNSKETREDHGQRFLDPIYSLEQYAESQIMVSRDLYCVDYEYPTRDEQGVYR